MPDLTHKRTALVAALIAALFVGACGGDDDKKASSAQAPATNPNAANPATTTETSTDEADNDSGKDKDKDGKTESNADDPASTTDVRPDAATPRGPDGKPLKLIPVNAPARSIKAGGLQVKMRVRSLLDPVPVEVDEPQPGNRFVGVFIESLASGTYEPAKVVAVASLTTDQKKAYSVRVIGGGDCEGAFFPAAFVLKSKKTRTGCVGFEIPKGAKAEELVLGVSSTTTGKGQTARWKLPAPS